MSPILLGWLFEVGAWVFFGSFAIPVKLPSVRRLRVDPIVFQSYKSAMVFLTGWIVLLWSPFSFTPWGIMSGLFWVPGGMLT